MELYQKFQVVQFLVILCACIIGTIQLRKTPSPERKYILPFCYIDLVVLGIIVYYYTINKYPNIIDFLVLLFNGCEIFLLSFYVQTITRKKRDFLYPFAVFTLSPILSIILFKNPTILPLLSTEIFLTHFAFKYIKWLFEGDRILKLNNSKHYWIMMGIILCYTISIPFWISFILVLASGESELYTLINEVLFIFYILLNIIMFILFIKAFLCNPQHQQYSSGQLQAQ